MSTADDKQIENGKTQFAEQFKIKVREKLKLDIEVKWNDKDEFSSMNWAFAVCVEEQRYVMYVNHESVLFFDMGDQDGSSKKLLNEKIEELKKKLN